MEFCEKFSLQAEKMLAYYGFANYVMIDCILVFKKATNL